MTNAKNCRTAVALILFSLFSNISTIEIAAQTRRAGRSAAASPASVSGGVKKTTPCAGGWSGVVTYKRTLTDSLDSDDPGIRKSIDRIEHKTSRNLDYSGRAVVDGSDPKAPTVNANVSFSDTDLNWGLEKVFDTCNATEKGHWFTIDSTDDRQTQGKVSGSAESFNLSVNDYLGTYSFSLKFPDAQGVYKREQHVKRAGHCQPRNNEPTDISTNEPTKVEGEVVSIEEQKLDPEHPDTLSGSKTWGDDGSGPIRTSIFQVSWRFTRCPVKLLITDLKFEHPKFPNFEDWKEIQDPKGTIDGNRVKVTATVLNISAETKYADLKLAETFKGDKYNGARADEPLPDGEVSLRLEGGEEKEVELIWDTEGQSWFDDGRPHLFHRIKAELAEGGQKKDEKEKPLNIAPKPLVLVHGLFSDYRVWEPLYQNLLTEDHSYQWKAYAVGKEPAYGLMNMGTPGDLESGSASVYDNADKLASYVKHAQTESNAWHVDMVAHSTGGLVARLYLHKLMPNVPDARPQVKHLVMLGTPNGGVQCIDIFVGKLGLFGKDLRSVQELTNDNMLDFNRFVVNTGGTKISARAGNPVPIVCGGADWNDGFVTVKSATYGVADNGQSNDLNWQLTDAKNFGGWVLPHIVTGPKGTYPIAKKNDPTDWTRWQIDHGNNTTGMWDGGSGVFEKPVAKDSYAMLLNERNPQAHGPNDGDISDPLPAAAKYNDSFTKQLSIEPKRTVDVDIPVEAAANFGLTFIANSNVGVSLLDANGNVVARSKAGTDFAHAMFRSLFYSHTVTGGTWKLRIENTSDMEQQFAGYGWTAEREVNIPTPTKK